MSETMTEGGYRAGPFHGLYHRFAITTQNPELADALATLYGPLLPTAEPGTEWTEYVVEPPVPGQLWQLRVDGRVTVRSSTAGGALRMLLQSVGDGIRRGPSLEDGQRSPDALRLDGAAVEIDGTGVLLLADRGLDLTAALVRLLDRHEDVLGYLGEVAVLIDADGLVLRSAPTPLSLHQEHWAEQAHLRERVPDGVIPYLDLTWPLPASALGRVVESTTLGVVLHLAAGEPLAEGCDDAAAGSIPDAQVETVGPADAVTRLVDRLPYDERGGLTAERLREVAGLVEQVDSLEVIADPDPAAVAAAVVTGVHARSGHRTSKLAP